MENNAELPLNAVGPGLEADKLPEGKSRIQGFDDTQFVELFNPMSVDFVGQVGRTVPFRVAAPPNIGGARDLDQWTNVTNEAEMRRTYGFDLRSNTQSRGVMHEKERHVLRAGESHTYLGAEAQVLAMQLVTAILQQEGHSNIGDPALREAAEARVVRATGSIRQQMDAMPQSERDQLKKAIAEMNDAPVTNMSTTSDEATEFPDATQPTGTSEQGGSPSDSEVSQPPRRLGRSPKET